MDPVLRPPSFPRTCRTCLCLCPADVKMQPVFAGHADAAADEQIQQAPTNWASMLRNFAGIQLEPADGLPICICIPCKTLLQAAFAFHQQCVNSNRMLQSLYAEKPPVPVEPIAKMSHEPDVLDIATVELVPDDFSSCIVAAENQQEDEGDGYYEEYIQSEEEAMDEEVKNATEVTADETNVAEDAADEKYSAKDAADEKYFAEDAADDKCFAEDAADDLDDIITMADDAPATDFNETAVDPLQMTLKPRKRKPSSSEHSNPATTPTKPKTVNPPLSPSKIAELCALSLGPKSMYVNSKLNRTGQKPDKMTGEKPFKCLVCGLAFWQNSNLKVHLRRHTGEKPYVCQFCSKGFPGKTELTMHERYHTGERTHLCGTCGKTFHRAYNLIGHMRVHTGERPYKCPHCDSTFSKSDNLKQHMLRHHVAEELVEKLDEAVDSE